MVVKRIKWTLCYINAIQTPFFYANKDSHLSPRSCSDRQCECLQSHDVDVHGGGKCSTFELPPFVAMDSAGGPSFFHEV